MVSARDLRHGNYYFNKYVGRIVKWNINIPHPLCENIESFEGIKITKNILWLFGFKQTYSDPKNMYLPVGSIYLEYVDSKHYDKGIYISADDSFPINDRPCIFVHELQNLFYDLQKEELW